MIAVGLIDATRAGLLALVIGAGLQRMASLMTADGRGALVCELCSQR